VAKVATVPHKTLLLTTVEETEGVVKPELIKILTTTGT
jgi:hypothetical protein